MNKDKIVDVLLDFFTALNAKTCKLLKIIFMPLLTMIAILSGEDIEQSIEDYHYAINTNMGVKDFWIWWLFEEY